MIDNNFESWRELPGKVEHRGRAFIIGGSLMDEQENLRTLLFGQKMNISNNNLFVFGMEEVNGSQCVILERIDADFRSTFEEEWLERQSIQRKRIADPDFHNRERRKREIVANEKEELRKLLSLDGLSPGQFADRTKDKIIRTIQQGSLKGFRNWGMAAELARACYLALLLERDENGAKTLAEFDDPDNVNVFNDARILQNAIWLDSGILSKDKALARMTEYLVLPRVKVMKHL